MILCERAGIRRFVLEAPAELRAATRIALGRFRDDPAVALVDALNHANPGLDPAAVGVRFDGNLVLAPSILRKALDSYRSSPGATVNVVSTDSEQGGSISIGPLQNLINDGIRLNPAAVKLPSMGVLPFALNGRP